MALLSEIDFQLPNHLIAQIPCDNRTDSRLLVLDKQSSSILHDQFKSLINYLNKGDALVLNNTKVVPARFCAFKAITKGKVGLLLSRVTPDGTWICLVESKRKLALGDVLTLKQSSITATLIDKLEDEPGAYQIAFSDNILDYADEHGQIPLPPYIDRASTETDKGRYQTVYADPKQNNAVAAPTAGLHFDKDLLKQIEDKGVNIVYVTLHVGPGTFLPLRTENLDEHKMHAEPWEVSSEAAETINNIKKNGGKVVAVGTTSIRTLESAFDPKLNQVKAGKGLTRLFIRPGYHFKVINAMVTNFHLPRTTLLLLVAAAVGIENLKLVYQKAIQKEYRFFSYGDACLFDVMDNIK